MAPRTATEASSLVRTITQMKKKRQELLEAIATIDSTFSQLGISVDQPTRRPGRPAGSGRGPGRPKGSTSRGSKGTRKRFSVSGEARLVQLVKKMGKPNAADLNRQWKTDGRGGKADNALSKLVKIGKLKRVKVKGERGSRYVTA